MYKWIFSILLIILLLTGYSSPKSNISKITPENGILTPVVKSQLSKEKAQAKYPILLTSASANTIDFVLQSEGIFCIYANQKYGFMTESGQEITSFDFDFAYPFSEGLACVCRNGKYGFINTKGELVLPFIYDKASSFSEGLAYFEIGDEYGLINKSGDKDFLLNCDSVSSFKEGLAYISSDGEYGYIDKSGNVVIKPLYDDVGYFHNGLAKVRIGSRIGVIDKSGKEIIQPIYDDVSITGSNTIIELNNKYGCINSKGMVILPPKYDAISVEENNMILFTTNEKWGLSDANGNIVLNPIYDYVELIPENNSAVIQQNEKWGIVDFSRILRVPLKYDRIFYNSQNGEKLVRVTLKNKTGFINFSDYTEMIPLIYDYAGDFRHGLAAVELGGKHGVIDEKGNIVLPFEYDNTEIFDNGMISFEQDNKYGLAAQDGKVIIKNQYDSIELYGSCYIVETDNTYGVLDINGNLVIPPTYSYISDYYNDVYNSRNSYITTKYGNSSVNNSILITDDDQEIDVSSLILSNQITPKIKLFSDYTKTGPINIYLSEIDAPANNCTKTFKLYDIDDSGKPILYFYAEPFIRANFQQSYSGFFSIKNNKVNELLTGYECGGSSGGDYVCLYKDIKTLKVIIGTFSHAGGFGGNAIGGTFYDFKSGKAYNIASSMRISQKVVNFKENDLLNNANLLYDDQGIPIAEGEIKPEDYITEYLVNGKRVTVDEYDNISKRFRSIPLGF